MNSDSPNNLTANTTNSSAKNNNSNTTNIDDVSINTFVNDKSSSQKYKNIHYLLLPQDYSQIPKPLSPKSYYKNVVKKWMSNKSEGSEHVFHNEIENNILKFLPKIGKREEENEGKYLSNFKYLLTITASPMVSTSSSSIGNNVEITGNNTNSNNYSKIVDNNNNNNNNNIFPKINRKRKESVLKKNKQSKLLNTQNNNNNNNEEGNNTSSKIVDMNMTEIKMNIINRLPHLELNKIHHSFTSQVSLILVKDNTLGDANTTTTLTESNINNNTEDYNSTVLAEYLNNSINYPTVNNENNSIVEFNNISNSENKNHKKNSNVKNKTQKYYKQRKQRLEAITYKEKRKLLEDTIDKYDQVKHIEKDMCNHSEYEYQFNIRKLKREDKESIISKNLSHLARRSSPSPSKQFHVKELEWRLKRSRNGKLMKQLVIPPYIQNSILYDDKEINAEEPWRLPKWIKDSTFHKNIDKKIQKLQKKKVGDISSESNDDDIFSDLYFEDDKGSETKPSIKTSTLNEIFNARKTMDSLREKHKMKLFSWSDAFNYVNFVENVEVENFIKQRNKDRDQVYNHKNIISEIAQKASEKGKVWGRSRVSKDRRTSLSPPPGAISIIIDNNSKNIVDKNIHPKTPQLPSDNLLINRNNDNTTINNSNNNNNRQFDSYISEDNLINRPKNNSNSPISKFSSLWRKKKEIHDVEMEKYKQRIEFYRKLVTNLNNARSQFAIRTPLVLWILSILKLYIKAKWDITPKLYFTLMLHVTYNEFTEEKGSRIIMQTMQDHVGITDAQQERFVRLERGKYRARLFQFLRKFGIESEECLLSSSLIPPRYENIFED